MNKQTLRVVAILTLVSGLSLAMAAPAAAAPIVLGDAPAIVAWFGGGSWLAAVREVVNEILTKGGTVVDESGSSSNGNGTGD